MKRLVYTLGYCYGKLLGYCFICYLAYKDGYYKVLRRKRPNVYIELSSKIINAIRKDAESKIMAEHREN